MKTLRNSIFLMAMLVMGFAVSYQLANNDPNAWEFERDNYRLEETNHFISDEDGNGVQESFIVIYQSLKNPSMIAKFWLDDPDGNAYLVMFDLNNNGKTDFILFDNDEDGYLNCENIICYENCGDIQYTLKQIREGLLTTYKSS